MGGREIKSLHVVYTLTLRRIDETRLCLFWERLTYQMVNTQSPVTQGRTLATNHAVPSDGIWEMMLVNDSVHLTQW